MTNITLTRNPKAEPPLARPNAVLIQLMIPARFRSAVLDQVSMTFALGVLGIPIFIYVVYQTVATGREVLLEQKLWEPHPHSRLTTHDSHLRSTRLKLR